MIKIILFVVLQFFLLHVSLAQLDNSLFENRRSLSAERENKVFLSFDFLGFTKNNEYFNKIADGYTLFGYHFNPHLTYFPAENVRIDAGVFLHKDFGNSGYFNIAPTFSLKVKRKKMEFIFGNLEGNLNHRLIEPLYDFERVMTDPLETGIQAIWNNEKLFLDMWIDWETMIYPGDTEQEEVSGGFSFDYSLLKNKKASLSLPVQTVLYHKGGQIDVSDSALVSLMNNVIGLSLSIPVSETGFLSNIQLDNYFIYYTDFSFEKKQPFNDGTGLYLNLTTDLKWFSFMTSYWQGNEFISIKGAPLYQSVSYTVNNPGYVEKERKLLIFRFLHDVEIFKNLHIISRFEPFWDINNQKFEFSHGLYVNYRPDFYLFKAKDSRHD